MKRSAILVILFLTISSDLYAGTFAIGGMLDDRKGRTVLTTDPCTQKIESFQLGTNNVTAEGMRRAFYFTGKGMTSEGCWKHEAGSVLLIWPTESVVRRWPIANFKLAKRTSLSWDDAP
jgi:hypothetical protein